MLDWMFSIVSPQRARAHAQRIEEAIAFLDAVIASQPPHNSPRAVYGKPFTEARDEAEQLMDQAGYVR